MIDGGAAVQAWVWKAPSAPESHNSEQDQALLDQYTRHVRELEKNDGSTHVTYTVDSLRVVRATRKEDYRWLSNASRLPVKDITRYILSHRSRFLQDEQDKSEVFDLDDLIEFGKLSISITGGNAQQFHGRNTRELSSSPITRSSSFYARKTTTRRAPPVDVPRAAGPPYLQFFRDFLQNPKSQSTSISSYQTSTSSNPIAAPVKRRKIVTDPVVSSSGRSEETNAASSPAIEVTSKAVPGFRRLPLPTDNIPKGRQPLQLATSLAGRKDRRVPTPPEEPDVGPLTKARARIKHPVTRKVPANGVPITALANIAALPGSKAISKAKHLHHFGGSWPLRPLALRNVSEGPDVTAYRSIEGVSENIEDFTLISRRHLSTVGKQRDTTSTATGHNDETQANAEASTYILPPALTALNRDLINGSGEVPVIASPVSLSGGDRDSNAPFNSYQDNSEFFEDGFAQLPDPDVHHITMTFATSPARSYTQANERRNSPEPQGMRDVKLDSEPAISMFEFLNLAFGDYSVMMGKPIELRRQKSRRNISAAHRSAVQHGHSLRQELRKADIQYFNNGRRGHWRLPLIDKSRPDISNGLVLGLEGIATGRATVIPSMIVWTLARVRGLLHFLQSLTDADTIDLISIFITPGDRVCDINVGCRSSLALPLRALLGDLVSHVNEDDKEVVTAESAFRAPAASVSSGAHWLSMDSGVTLEWWDEIERRPVLTL